MYCKEDVIALLIIVALSLLVGVIARLSMDHARKETVRIVLEGNQPVRQQQYVKPDCKEKS